MTSYNAAMERGCASSSVWEFSQQLPCNGGNDGAISRPEGHISRRALSLAWLQQFSHELGDLTSQQLVEQVVKPATTRNMCRYTDMLLEDGAIRDVVSQGKPFYFISHAWSRPFKETLGMVLQHFEPKQQQLWRRKDGQQLPLLQPEEVFVWFGMFAVNQHVNEQNTTDLEVLWEAVHDAEETLMVLDPEGTVLTRVWCLYEAWQARRAGMHKLRLLLYGHNISQLKKLFIDLDVRYAVAIKEEDRVRILEAIQHDSGGLHAMTQVLKETLIAGVLAQVCPLVETWGTNDKGTCTISKATMLQEIRDLEAACSNAVLPVWSQLRG